MEGRAVIWATFLATLGGAAIAAGIAWKDAGGDPLAWWLVAGAFLVAAIAIALLGIVKPYRKAERLWNQTDAYPSPPVGYRADHSFSGGGITLAVAPKPPGNPAPLPFYLCELKRRGQTLSYVADLTERRIAHPTTTAEIVHFPGDFTAADGSPVPSVHWDEFQACFMQVWWAYDEASGYKGVPVARECFRIFGSGGANDMAEQKCKTRCRRTALDT